MGALSWAECGVLWKVHYTGYYWDSMGSRVRGFGFREACGSGLRGLDGLRHWERMAGFTMIARMYDFNETSEIKRKPEKTPLRILNAEPWASLNHKP